MTEPHQDDELTQRYREASAQDTRRPGDHVREIVRAHAQNVIASTSDDAARPLDTRTPAANQSRWKISLLASIALAGITGLLVLQFDRGAPEEKELVYGRPDAPSAAPSPVPPAAKSEPGEKARSRAAPAKAPPKPTASIQATPAAPALPAPTQAQESTNRAYTAPAAEAGGTNAAVTTARTPAAQPGQGKLALRVPQARAKALASHDSEEAVREAARRGDTMELERLIAQGAAVNARDEAGRTALMLAVMNKHTATAQRLLALGANAAVKDREGFTALQHARRLGLDGIAALLESGS